MRKTGDGKHIFGSKTLISPSVARLVVFRDALSSFVGREVMLYRGPNASNASTPLLLSYRQMLSVLSPGRRFASSAVGFGKVLFTLNSYMAGMIPIDTKTHIGTTG